jgi:hypothetical protein
MATCRNAAQPGHAQMNEGLGCFLQTYLFLTLVKACCNCRIMYEKSCETILQTNKSITFFIAGRLLHCHHGTAS